MKETIEQFKKYFDLREVVSKKVFERYGEQAWQFFDPRLLEVVIWLRKSMGIPLVCNNWANGGSLQQRGFRANLDQMVYDKTKQGKFYCSAHCRGMGIDLSSGRATAPSIRQYIRTHMAQCPYPIRLEDDKSAPTWVHIDVCNTTNKKLIEFSA